MGESICWLNDPEMLPKVFPRARIMSYGYNANVVRDCARGRIRNYAEDLLNELDVNRLHHRVFIHEVLCF